MERIYIDDKSFTKIDFTTAKFEATDYENCSFVECNLSEVNLSGITFSECNFTGCNFSLAKLLKTGFRSVHFIDCKLLGLHFDHCDVFLFSVSFEKCLLNLSSFYKLKMKKTHFNHCTLYETDFAETDLNSAHFNNCDLAGAIFENTNLENTDFRTAINFTIDPEKNKLRNAYFSLTGLPGLLHRYNLKIE